MGAARANRKSYLKLAGSGLDALYAAPGISEHIPFQTVDRDAARRGRQALAAALTGEPVLREDWIKAFEPDNEIDTAFFGKPCCLVPSGRVRDDAFALIRETLWARAALRRGVREEQPNSQERDRARENEPGAVFQREKWRWPMPIADTAKIGSFAERKAAVLRAAQLINCAKGSEADFEFQALTDAIAEFDILEEERSPIEIPPGFAHFLRAAHQAPDAKARQ